jgi:hypothetical protein
MSSSFAGILAAIPFPKFFIYLDCQKADYQIKKLCNDYLGSRSKGFDHGALTQLKPLFLQ